MTSLLGFAWPISEVAVECLGWVLVHSLWQCALVAFVAGLIVRVLRCSAATTRYGVLVAALMLSIALPVVTMVMLENNDRAETTAIHPAAPEIPPRSGDTVNVTPIANIAASPSAPEAHAEVSDSIESKSSWLEQAAGTVGPSLQPWLVWIVFGWSVGVMLCAARPLLGWYMLRRLQRVGVSPASDELQAAIRRLSERMGLRGAVRVVQSTLTHVPILVGCLRPLILLPVGLVSSIPAVQWEAILAHELAHVRRHDFLVNLLQTLVETLFFYHPAVWWMSRQIRIEREHCCDDLVVTLLDNRVEYGRALVAIEQLRGQQSVLALGAGDGSLLARVRRIVGINSQRDSHSVFDRWPMAALSLAGMGIVLTLSMSWSLAAMQDQPQEKSSAAADPQTPQPAGPPNHFDVSFRNTTLKDVLIWYGRVVGERIEFQVEPKGTFSYESPRPLNQLEIILLVNREVLKQGYCLVQKKGGLTVQSADVIARQNAEELRKNFMGGSELRKGPDKFEAYFEIVNARIVGATEPPAPSGPATAYTLKANRDYTAEQLTDFFRACFGDVAFPSLKTGHPVLADGFAVLHKKEWLRGKAPALKKGEQIEVWQNRAEEWNVRTPADFHIVVEGRVIGADGKPVANARVQQFLAEDGGDLGGPADLKQFLNWVYGGDVVVDKQGKFQLSLRHQTQFVRKAWIYAVAPGYAPQRIGPLAVDLKKPAVPVTIELKPGFTGRVKLLLPDGKPIEKGQVDVSAQDDIRAEGISMGTLSITADPLRIENCPAGPVVLRVRMPGIQTQEIRDMKLVADKVTEVTVPLLADVRQPK